MSGFPLESLPLPPPEVAAGDRESIMKAQENSAKQAVRKDESADDTWLSDLPNDLEALSLSSHRPPSHHSDEMGFGIDRSFHADEPHHRHADVGI